MYSPILRSILIDPLHCDVTDVTHRNRSCILATVRGSELIWINHEWGSAITAAKPVGFIGKSISDYTTCHRSLDSDQVRNIRRPVACMTGSANGRDYFMI
jgi:hypothetical protein